jgi:hypothetical protein
MTLLLQFVLHFPPADNSPEYDSIQGCDNAPGCTPRRTERTFRKGRSVRLRTKDLLVPGRKGLQEVGLPDAAWELSIVVEALR